MKLGNMIENQYGNKGLKISQTISNLRLSLRNKQWLFLKDKK